MTTTFQRQANRLLADAGYEFVCANGSGHEVWRKLGRPDIHVPGSPSGGRDSMLARVRRAIRKGTALTPPSGQETDMPRPAKTKTESKVDQMVSLASSALTKRAAEIRRVREKGGTRSNAPRAMDEMTAWVERCLKTCGRISGADFRAAGDELEIQPPDLSVARKRAGAVTYRQPGMGQHDTWTDFSSRLPKDAMVFGGRAKKKEVAAALPPKERPDPPKEKAEEQPLPPPDPEHVGRRLERGGLTDEQHAEAERRMREGHLRAEEERQAILSGRSVPGPDAVVGENGNGNGTPSQLDIALQLLRDAALADTHAITPADIILLRGHQDTLLRTADDLRGMAASITAILTRVQAGLTPEGLPAA